MRTCFRLIVVSGSLNRWYVIYIHLIGSIYHLHTTYILPFAGLYNPCHLLWEPETTVD